MTEWVMQTPLMERGADAQAKDSVTDDRNT